VYMFRGDDRLQREGVEKDWRKKIVCRTLIASPCVSLRESRRLGRRWWNFYTPSSYFSSRHLSHKRRRRRRRRSAAQRARCNANEWPCHVHAHCNFSFRDCNPHRANSSDAKAYVVCVISYYYYYIYNV